MVYSFIRENRRWRYCDKCGNAYWMGFSFPFYTCYECLTPKQKKQFDKNTEWKEKLDERNKNTQEYKREIIKRINNRKE